MDDFTSQKRCVDAASEPFRQYSQVRQCAGISDARRNYVLIAESTSFIQYFIMSCPMDRKEGRDQEVVLQSNFKSILRQSSILYEKAFKIK